MAEKDQMRNESPHASRSPIDTPTLFRMPRAPRLQLAGGLFHVTTRSAAWRAILPNDDARAACLDLIEKTCVRYHWRCHAYCVMTTHYHLLITTPEPNLSRGMQWLNGL